MNSDLLGKLFEDKKTLATAVKISLIFGPGFLSIGYFNKQAFVELDWLKLLSLSALFTIVFLLPCIVIIWLLDVLIPLKHRRQLKALESEKTELIDRLTHLHEEAKKLSQSTDNSKEQKKLAKIIREVEEMISDLKKRDKVLKKAHKRISDFFEKNDLYTVAQNNWFLLLILFGQVVAYIGADYFLHPRKRATFNSLMHLLTVDYYMFIPLLLIGTWVIYRRKLIFDKKLGRIFCLISGVALIVIDSFLLKITLH